MKRVLLLFFLMTSVGILNANPSPTENITINKDNDKAKPRVIVGRLPAVTGGGPAAPKRVQAGKATPACRNAIRHAGVLACMYAYHLWWALRRAGTGPIGIAGLPKSGKPDYRGLLLER
jgi:hypothetical protein